MKSPYKGFTLIELLVVIAIMGVLSTVVLAALNTSRARAKDAAVKTHVREFGNLMALQFSDTGSYAPLQVGWTFSPSAGFGPQRCSNAAFTGAYASKAREVCETIIAANGSGVYFGNTGNPDQFSIMAALPGKGTVYCLGSSGRSSDTEVGSAASTWTSAGCSANP